MNLAHSKSKPATPEAVRLMFDGSRTMAKIEKNGLRVDMERLKDSIRQTESGIEESAKELRSSPEYKEWRRVYGINMMIDAPSQLGRIIFDVCGHKRNPMMTDRMTGRASNDVYAFEHLNLPFLKTYFAGKRLRKAMHYLIGFMREAVLNGKIWLIRPFFDLHTAESYRSSSSRINFQNLPVRDKWISEIVRSCIIPRKGRVLIEADYSGAEVRVSACYNHDPKLISYVTGGGDMHKDMAKRLYLLKDDQLDKKDIRYCAKNKFVFPEVSGSVYAQCAPNLWDAISMMGLKRADGVGLYDHLADEGITKLGACDFESSPVEGTFEYQVHKVERWMWEDVFTVYNQWKKDWWARYLKEGGLTTLTGFRMEGVFRRNQVLCDPIQGSSFHCLLWSLIRIVNQVEERDMDTKVICQIHDSSLADVPEAEVPEYIEMVKDISVNQIAKAWDWLVVPLEVEVEVCSENWFQKIPYKPEETV